MNNKEIVLALYDDSASNKNIMPRRQAEQYAEEIKGEELATMSTEQQPKKRRMYPFVACDIVLVKEANLHPLTSFSGLVVAHCAFVERRERRC